MIESVATWVLTYALHSSVLGGAGLIAARNRRVDAASRCVILRCALFLPLVTASLGLTTLNTARPIRVTSPVRRLLPDRIAYPSVNVEVTSVTGSQPRRVVTVTDEVGLGLASILFTLVSLSGAAGLAIWIRRNRAARRALSARTPMTHSFCAASQRGIRISSSPALAVPVALHHREICVPAHLDEMPAPEQESVMLHEVAHIDRHDPAWMDAARLMSAITWWQPLNRLLCDRLECETEIAADQHAIAIGAQPRALVSALAQFSSRLNSAPLHVGAALVTGGSPLITRATLLLDRTAGTTRLSSRVVLALTLCVAGLLVALPTPTTAARVPAIHGAGQLVRNATIEREVTFIKRGGNPPR